MTDTVTDAPTDRFYVGAQPLYVGTAPYTTVTAASHPLTHAAFEAISADTGYGSGRDGYHVPAAWSARIAQTERGLARLPDAAARTEFAVGEEGGEPAPRDSHPDLAEAHALLNDFFDGADTTHEPQDADA